MILCLILIGIISLSNQWVDCELICDREFGNKGIDFHVIFKPPESSKKSIQ